MKVLHINCNYTGTRLHQTMIEHLDIYNIKSDVFVPTYDKSISSFGLNDNVTVSECFKRWDRLLFFYKNNKIKKSVLTHYDIKGYDLIHAYTLFTDGNVAFQLSQKYNIPFVVAIRKTDVYAFLKYKPYLKKRAKHIIKSASAVFFLSDTYRENVLARLFNTKEIDELKERIYVIPNGIDDFWHNNQYTQRRSYESDHSLKLIYAGVIDKNKNVKATVEALQRLSSKGIKSNFTVVGRIKEQSAYDEIANAPSMRYIEACPKEELLKYYRAADLFVMPSHNETFGLVYAEALSQGLPILYTKGQGFDGQFKEGEVGYAVDDHDPDDIAEKIELIIQRYDEITSKCVQASEKYNWNRLCEDYAAIYKGISR